MAGGEQFGGGGARDLRGKPANRRRLQAVEVDSLDGEEEGGATELLSTSARLGKARNGDPRWQPWTTVRFHVSREEGRAQWEKKESARERGKGGGGGVALLNGSRGVALAFGSGEQEVASAVTGSFHAPAPRRRQTTFFK
jgi:hypothetical protein